MSRTCLPDDSCSCNRCGGTISGGSLLCSTPALAAPSRRTVWDDAEHTTCLWALTLAAASGRVGEAVLTSVRSVPPSVVDTPAACTLALPTSSSPNASFDRANAAFRPGAPPGRVVEGLTSSSRPESKNGRCSFFCRCRRQKIPTPTSTNNPPMAIAAMAPAVRYFPDAGLGAAVGDELGVGTGTALVGPDVGSTVGPEVGSTVGPVVGSAVDPTVGSNVTFAVTFTVGITVVGSALFGAGVGVGRSVGSGVKEVTL
mmetsp:Transcript_35666/g.106426  ORF Transcript_35666/g.106426 Transcript_35666/m.106426 type:complete len:257 (+) Transcript_35666:944-1714(+)